ncbi:MAG TPA: GGDEF domain-containing protein [Acidimicrobiales bacterium]|jgi:diguanylate cyclase (GGDEF)-like protein|nr:GGDEF domain-containing protein [Acidimicrobiales bacterium]
MTTVGGDQRDRRESLAALGRALARRSGTVASAIADRWAETGGFDRAQPEELRSELERFTVLATTAVANYLITGEAPTQGESEELSQTGRAPVDNHLSLAGLTRLYLLWRDAAEGAVREEADRLECSTSIIDEAVNVVRAGADGSLVGMSKQFDLAYGELRAQLAEEQARLGFLALHDPLTGLPNRALFIEQLTRALGTRGRPHTQVAVLYLDIDHFKAVNDLGGHSVGDQLLIAFATRIQEVVRPGDTAARLGGDEFVVLCEGLRGGHVGAAALAARIGDALAEPLTIEGKVVSATASIGVAVAIPGDDPGVVLSHADGAMYLAKQRGRARYELYTGAN